jgi:hypothetical protein
MQSSNLKNANEPIEKLETVETIENTRLIQNANEVLCPINKHCIVCNSGMAPEVNAMRADGSTLREIAAHCTAKGTEIGKMVVSRHFNRYNTLLRHESSFIAYENFKRDAETIGKHQTQTLFLMSYAFNELCKRIQNGTLQIGIEEYEKLTKLYYQVLEDPSRGVAPDMMEIYMRAVKTYKMPPLNNTSLPFEESNE